MKEVESVIHIDSAARLQMVTKNYNSSFYAILQKFSSLTVYSILVNTRFNIPEESIVCSPYDALKAL